jgi:signal transduction histidine kinase
MSSLENIYQKMSPNLEPATLAHLHHEQSPADAQKHIGRDTAHELNNILTIIRGYADRMILKHGDNPALRPDLQLISENVKRAESVVRHSTWPRRVAVAAA